LTHVSAPFQVLHPFFDSLLPLDTDARVAATHAALPAIQAVVCRGQQRQGSATCAPLHDASHHHDGAAPGQGKGAKRDSSDPLGEHALAHYRSACVWYADCRFISFHFSSVQLSSIISPSVPCCILLFQTRLMETKRSSLRGTNVG
jgi:hypothetical protein